MFTSAKQEARNVNFSTALLCVVYIVDAMFYLHSFPSKQRLKKSVKTVITVGSLMLA